jgi:heme oxygenase (mycobilin-producing)
MTVVRINAITVPPGSGDELARRFAARAGAVDQADGFVGFELLKPTDERDTWLVVTHWRDEDAFQAWVRSPAFAHGHRGVAGSGPGHGHGEGHGGEASSGAEAQGSADGAAAPPLATHSELWSYDVVDLGRGK